MDKVRLKALAIQLAAQIAMEDPEASALILEYTREIVEWAASHKPLPKNNITVIK